MDPDLLLRCTSEIFSGLTFINFLEERRPLVVLRNFADKEEDWSSAHLLYIHYCFFFSLIYFSKRKTETISGQFTVTTYTIHATHIDSPPPPWVEICEVKRANFRRENKNPKLHIQKYKLKTRKYFSVTFT